MPCAVDGAIGQAHPRLTTLRRSKARRAACERVRPQHTRRIQVAQSHAVCMLASSQYEWRLHARGVRTASDVRWEGPYVRWMMARLGADSHALRGALSKARARIEYFGRYGGSQVDVDAEQFRRGLHSHLLDDESTLVATLGYVSRVAEALHQHRPGSCHAGAVPVGGGRLWRGYRALRQVKCAERSVPRAHVSSVERALSPLVASWLGLLGADSVCPGL
jgi:hypothetical protein